MPGQNNLNQQSQSNSANDVSTSGGSIMGYTSPYSGQAQPPFTQITSNSPTQQNPVQKNNIPEAKPPVSNPVPSQQQNQSNEGESMDLQSYMNTNTLGNNSQTQQVAPQQQQQPIQSSNSDNILDDPNQVQEILANGEPPVPQEQPVVINQMNQNQQDDPVLQETTPHPKQIEPQSAPSMPAEQNQPQTKRPAETPVQNQQPVLENQPLGISQSEIPDFLQNPSQMQADVQEELRKEKEAMALQEQKAKEAEAARKAAAAAYQAPQQRNKPNFNNQPQKPAEPLNPDQDLRKVTPQAPTGSNKKFSNIGELLDIVISRNASDLHLTVGYAPHIRIDDKLIPIGAELNKDEVKTFVSQSLSQNQKELLEVNREVDLSYQHKNAGRFRINAYYERGNMAAAYRLIPQRIRTTTELGLPNTLLDFTKLSQGLFLVTGPTGSGKSTTLAGMLQYINSTEQKHIITVEDPIEYVYPKGEAVIDQRELGSDTHDWSIALKSALRQDPDVILIGELRDFETIQAAITLAETGHLVFATLHTNSASQSIDRIIDVFPPHQQQQIRTQLAGALKGILSQRLVPLIGGGRKAVIELLIVTPAVQNLIREGKTYQMDNVVATSADLGMISLEKSLVKLVREGKITVGTAQDYAIRPEEILKFMKNGY